ncbi:MAG: DedA family protein, partial [Lactococcus lactis]
IVLVCLGAALGDNWEMIAGILDSYSSVVVVILGIIFILAILIFVKKRFFPKNKNYSSDTEK